MVNIFVKYTLNANLNTRCIEYTYLIKKNMHNILYTVPSLHW